MVKRNGRPGKSGYVGVYKHSNANRWGAKLQVGKQVLYIGLFPTAEAAARAYDAKARAHGKQDLNFPDEIIDDIEPQEREPVVPVRAWERDFG